MISSKHVIQYEEDHSGCVKWPQVYGDFEVSTARISGITDYTISVREISTGRLWAMTLPFNAAVAFLNVCRSMCQGPKAD